MILDFRFKCAYDWGVPIEDVKVLETFIDEKTTSVVFEVQGEIVERMGFPDSMYVHKTIQ